MVKSNLKEWKKKKGLRKRCENSPAFMTKATKGITKKIGERRMSWSGKCLRLQGGHVLNYKVKLCSVKNVLSWKRVLKMFIMFPFRKTYLMEIIWVKMAITRKDPIHLKWIPSPIFSESAKLGNHSTITNSRKFVKPLREALMYLETHLKASLQD